MPRPIPKDTSAVSMEPLWRGSCRFLPTGMRVSAKRGGKSNHFAGGPAPAQGSKCPGCKQKLTLVWDIDLADPLFPAYVREGFAPASRLPLMICWNCLAVSYAVLGDIEIKCFRFDDHTDPLAADETPFAEAPVELPRRPLMLRRISSTDDALLALEDTIGLDAFDRPARQAIDKFYGCQITSPWDMPFSQVGGQLIHYQSRAELACPQRKCPASKLEYPYATSERSLLMKELALIHFDVEKTLATECFQLLYHICPVCFAIRAQYRCS